jgi:hypothetical protein
MQIPQSIFLLLSAILFGTSLFFPFGYAQAAPETVFADTQLTVSDNITLMTLPMLAAFSAFAAVFMHSYKYNKNLFNWQRRLSIFASFLALATVGLAAYFLFASNASAPSVGISLFSPIVAIVFLYLTIRATNRDESVIKSANRIR